MSAKFFVLFACAMTVCSAGLIPAALPAAVHAAVPAAVAAPLPAALTVGTYATSYNAHAVNHAIAAPYVAAPAFAAAPYVAHAPLAYSGLPSATYVAGRR